MNIEEILPKLIRCGLENDMKSFEMISLTIANKLKNKNKELSNEIIQALSYKNMGSSAFRSIGINDTPISKKNGVELAKIEDAIEIEEPIFSSDTKQIYEKFLIEQNNIEELLKFGVKADNSILIYGEPGVGKTYSAKWLAYKLDKPIINLDLSSVISSYLGETGSNLKSVLDYAKEVNGILFLDEFDAIAKKRDDSRDIGELKRIVNVLLKELEDWPANSIIIAATNHPELLDKAIWRRFDVKINIPIPTYELRKNIIARELGSLKNNKKEIDLLSGVTEGVSSAEVVRLCKNVKKSYILESKDIHDCIISNIKIDTSNLKPSEKSDICKKIKKYNPKVKTIEIEKITGIPSSSIYRYLSNEI